MIAVVILPAVVIVIAAAAAAAALLILCGTAFILSGGAFLAVQIADRLGAIRYLAGAHLRI